MLPFNSPNSSQVGILITALQMKRLRLGDAEELVWLQRHRRRTQVPEAPAPHRDLYEAHDLRKDPPGQAGVTGSIHPSAPGSGLAFLPPAPPIQTQTGNQKKLCRDRVWILETTTAGSNIGLASHQLCLWANHPV